MYSLEHSADPPDASVYMGVSEEIRREVAVEAGLHRRGRVYPQRGVEQDVVQQLPGNKGLAERLQLA